ncbi:hypothetical protein D9757_013086 [Collybiopsis confluens]|uniref:Fungal-type protein kinase domain-containing protein n=1 Tax=Collybiopsis confluens TaxID=2823264 RepID=A0A8H5LPU7_9AGAR|nr:hypothetical protein D9757_013086 [Collybiopsis confluens]
MAIEVYQLSRMLDRSESHEREQPQGFPPTVICPDIIFFPIHDSMRSLRVVGMEKLEPLFSLRSAREFAQVFYDILQSLLSIPSFCDPFLTIFLQFIAGFTNIRRFCIVTSLLSMANIMFRREGDKVYGVLNDFVLSSFRSRMDKDLTSKHQTGTKPFMACDLLNLEWDKGHLYQHNLESLFYIILILSCQYTEPTTRASSPPFADWFDGVDQFIASLKLDFLQSLSPDLPIQTYYNGFHKWLLHTCHMDQGYKSRPGAFFRSDKDRTKAVLYDWETLNGNVTYLEMMEVMHYLNL